MNTPKTDNTARPAFGAVMADHMAVAVYGAGAWSPFDVRPTEAIPLHPGAHVLHYASTCFEGFKAYRGPDGRGTSSAWTATSSDCDAAPARWRCRFPPLSSSIR